MCTLLLSCCLHLVLAHSVHRLRSPINSVQQCATVSHHVIYFLIKSTLLLMKEWKKMKKVNSVTVTSSSVQISILLQTGLVSYWHRVEFIANWSLQIIVLIVSHCYSNIQSRPSSNARRSEFGAIHEHRRVSNSNHNHSSDSKWLCIVSFQTSLHFGW